MPQPFSKWSRLSDTYHAWHAPDTCTHCGSRVDPPRTLTRWLEHDDNDRPSDPPVVILLCDTCNACIDPHPRLYSQLDRYAPIPGVMRELCLSCPHRHGLTCGITAPTITVEEPIRGHMSYSGKTGRRQGRFFTMYPNPPTACTGNPNPRPETLL